MLVDGEDVYGPNVDPVLLRRKVGLIFQKPNPFPKTIYENVAFGVRLHRSEEHTSELQSLMRISYAVFCLKKKKQTRNEYNNSLKTNQNIQHNHQSRHNI